MELPAREDLLDIEWLTRTHASEGFKALIQYLRLGAETFEVPVTAIAEALADPLFSRYRRNGRTPICAKGSRGGCSAAVGRRTRVAPPRPGLTTSAGCFLPTSAQSWSRGHRCPSSWQAGKACCAESFCAID